MNTNSKWSVFAGTMIRDEAGNTLLCACEECEGRGGTFESIRETIKASVREHNEHAALVAVAVAAENFSKHQNAGTQMSLRDSLAALAAVRAT